MNEQPLVSRSGWFGFGLVVGLSLLVYALTMAPTLSFWDCGEFIATASILGIPHPPGSPLYVFIGRLFSILPIASDPAVRVNLLSAVSSAIAAGFLFLSILAVTRDWVLTDSKKADQSIRFLAAATGALLAAFGLTQWNNSVEAEVYGLAMAILFAVLLLTIGLLQTQDQGLRWKYLILSIFLSVLGVAVHMTVALMLPILLIVGSLRSDTPKQAYQDLLLLVFFILCALVAFSSKAGELPLWLFGIPFGVLSILLLTYAAKGRWSPICRISSFLSLAPILILIAPAQAQFLGLIGIVGAVGSIVVTLIWQFTASSDKDRPPRALLTAHVALAILLLIQISGVIGMVPFIVITALAGLLFLWTYRECVYWQVLVSLAAAAMVVTGVVPFGIALLVSVAVAIVAALIKLPGWKVALTIPVVAAIGFSFHLTIPIRSAQHPLINENAPYRSVRATIDFIERKQYGSESMLKRMFVRRAEWTNQFGLFQRIGLYGYLQEQSTSRQFFAPFLLFVALSIWELMRRKPSQGAVFSILLLLATVGLVLYMNFADGTRIDPRTGEDYLEVRERDYFFTPGFMLFGAMVGIGILSFLSLFRTLGVSVRPVIGLIFSSLCLAALPAGAIASNWSQADRSRVYIPYDYARALLDSVEPNGVLVTAGDNDTFPLWCLQHTYKHRLDVRVVNTSLANLDWYISQLQDYYDLPLGLSDEDFSALRPFRSEDGRVFMVSDQIVNAIITRYVDSLPIYFATTVGADQRAYDGRNVDSLLVLEGAALRYDPMNRIGMTVNVEKSVHLFLDSSGFNYRGYADPTIRKDAATLFALSNITNAVEVTAETVRARGDVTTAERLARLAVDSFPRSRTAIELLVSLLMEQGKQSEADSLLQLNRDIDIRRVAMSSVAVLRQRGDVEGTVARLRSILDQSNDYRPALDELMRTHLATNNFRGMLADLQQWVTRNPNDSDIARAYQMLLSDSTVFTRARSGQ